LLWMPGWRLNCFLRPGYMRTRNVP
jgi:hypothetical protein